MVTGVRGQGLEEARRLRAELRLALAQADELMKKAEAVLERTQVPGHALTQEPHDQARPPALLRGGL